jgi:hypothetical protein
MYTSRVLRAENNEIKATVLCLYFWLFSYRSFLNVTRIFYFNIHFRNIICDMFFHICVRNANVKIPLRTLLPFYNTAFLVPYALQCINDMRNDFVLTV